MSTKILTEEVRKLLEVRRVASSHRDALARAVAEYEVQSKKVGDLLHPPAYLGEAGVATWVRIDRATEILVRARKVHEGFIIELFDVDGKEIVS